MLQTENAVTRIKELLGRKPEYADISLLASCCARSSDSMVHINVTLIAFVAGLWASKLVCEPGVATG